MASWEDREPYTGPAEQERMVYAGRFVQPGPTYRLNRGDPMQPREQLAADALAAIEAAARLAGLDARCAEQQRAAGLGPLDRPARQPAHGGVLVQPALALSFWHRDRGLAFGLWTYGRSPTHPELLDWLAAELVRGRWRLKPMHRLILLSNTYRQSSARIRAAWPATRATVCFGASRHGDWRPKPFATRSCSRAGFWISPCTARDSAPSSRTTTTFAFIHPKKRGARRDWRRMVYMNKVRREQDGVFGAFDAPDAGQVCPRRSRSTTPLQALNLLNSSFLVQQSELLAKRVERESRPEIPDRTRRASS